MSNKSPPWVLFVDHDKPVAILPAGRPGEVANVSHLTMQQAQEIVRLGNKLYHALVMAKMQWVGSELERLTARLDSHTRKVWSQARHIEPTTEGAYLVDCNMAGCEDPTHYGGDIVESAKYQDRLRGERKS